MPIFPLRCECGNTTRFMAKNKCNPPNCKKCGKKMFFTVGLPSSRTMVTADEYRGKSVVDGIDSLVEGRAKEFFQKHELPRLIAEEGVESAKQKGFVDEDGTPV